VSIKWPHSSAVTLGATGASAATAMPTDKNAVNPAVSIRAVVEERFVKKE